MTESPSPTFVETVEGIGTFTFRRRNMRTDIASQMEFRRLSEGMALDGFQATFLQAYADLKTMIVDPPPGWTPAEIDDMDAYDDASYGRIFRVWSALRGKEETFRAAGAAVQGDS